MRLAIYHLRLKSLFFGDVNKQLSREDVFLAARRVLENKNGKKLLTVAIGKKNVVPLLLKVVLIKSTYRLSSISSFLVRNLSYKCWSKIPLSAVGTMADDRKKFFSCELIPSPRVKKTDTMLLKRLNNEVPVKSNTFNYSSALNFALALGSCLGPEKSRMQKSKGSKMDLLCLRLMLVHRSTNDVQAELLLRCGDMETNPGPQPDADGQDASDVPEVPGEGGKRSLKGIELQVVTQNVRGLSDSKKVRHLVNRCYKMCARGTDSCFMFQETYVQNLELLRYIWRGEFHLTAGTGNSQGCLTLVTSPLKILRSIELGMRGHILILTKNDINKVEMIVANLYAPNGVGDGKVQFFNEVIDELSELMTAYNCRKVILAGDLNLVFNEAEVRNRIFSETEKRTSGMVKDIFAQAGLVDGWNLASSRQFTWTTCRTGEPAFSVLDRVLFNEEQLCLEDKVVDWSLSVSDHAAVIARFKKKVIIKSGTLLSRLDPRVLQDEEGRTLLNDAFNELFRQTSPQWNPHVSLEYAKMCIRTAAATSIGKLKARYRDEEATLNADINDVIPQLASESSTERKTLLVHKLDNLRQLKRALVTKIGKRLELRTARQWYNEGELSNKYFFNLLNRKTNDEVTELIGEDGVVIKEQAMIETEIRKFYKTLYESTPE